jgi:UDP-glucuronate 4-epimerase
MALFIFTKAILEDKPIKVFNHGNMLRDFTYVDDIVEGIVRVMNKTPQSNPAWKHSTSDISESIAPYKIYNIGNNSPVKLTDFIEAIEDELGKKATKELLPLQPGDVPETYADVSDLVRDVGYKPNTSVAKGVRNFIDWYKKYYHIN